MIYPPRVRTRQSSSRVEVAVYTGGENESDYEVHYHSGRKILVLRKCSIIDQLSIPDGYNVQGHPIKMQKGWKIFGFDRIPRRF